MGYYSDVAYAIKFEKDASYKVDTPDDAKTYEGNGAFLTFLTEAMSREDTKLCFEDSDIKVDKENRTISFYVCSIKWYEGSFKDVDCHLRLMHLADEYINQYAENEHIVGSPINWGFARIGEESGDEETRHGGDWGYELVEIRREIDLHVHV